MNMLRSWAFARHIPPRQIAARLMLETRRRVAQRFTPSLHAPAGLTLAANPSLPVFAPRAGKIERAGGGWRFTFLNRSLESEEQVDWSIPSPRPADQLWRMNLHYMEYLESLDADAGLPLIAQWIAANPPYTRAYWRDSWNSYALSLRVVVWMQWLARERVAPPHVIESLGQQLRFLERNLEIDIGGNHLIKNIKALLWASAFFAGRPAERWRRRGLALLAREMRHQILSDGVHYERSPSYHAQVFADLLEIRRATGNGSLDDVLPGMATAIALLAHPDGGPALFNDAGLTMAYSPDECLAAYRAVTGRDTPTPHGTFALTQGGYFGLRSPGFTLIADMGKLGPDELPAHAHGDIGSFELSLAGERFIVDQGVFEYVAGNRRAASRAAASHNTVSIDGVDQAEFFGAFRCGARAATTILEHRAEADALVLEGEHDGFARLGCGPIHRRRIEAGSHEIVIEDTLTPALERPGQSALLLHPEVEAALLAPERVRLTRGDAAIVVTGSLALRLEPALWWPDMGVELAAQRIVMKLPVGSDGARWRLTADH